MQIARRRRILELVNERRAVSVEELAALFPVSAITIRRDLDRLAEDHLVERVHGGAVALPGKVVAPRASAARLTPEQGRIGREAAGRVRDGEVLVLESGSTCQAVIPYLAERRNLKVVTVSVRILAALAELAEARAPSLEIICSGGTLNVHRDFLMGPQARALFEDLHVDLALHSVTAIDLEAGITADSSGEAEITRTILTRSARRRIGLIVSSKFQTASFVRVAPAEAFDEIITDAGLDPAVAERYRRRGIRLTEV